MASTKAEPAERRATSKTAIAVAIEEMRRSGITLHRLAKEAGVAPVSVLNIRDDKFHLKAGESDKGIAGKASTLTRLTLHVNEWLTANGFPELRLKTVLAEYDIDAKAPDVGRTISNVRSQAGEHRHTNDPVLRQIALRQNKVNIGILKWSPFFRDADPSPDASWAGDYSRRLVGSINPTAWEISKLQAISDIDAAVSAVGSGSSSLDAIYGVYDTPDKRLKGLRFVTLPGIAMPLSFVSVGDSVDWIQINRPDEEFKDKMRAIVLKGEVGDLFLLGPCQYPPSKLERFKSLDLQEMVRVYFGMISRRPNAPIFFCADRSMCRDFVEMASTVAVTDDTVLKALKDLRISEPNPIAPKYRLGMAVRADAQVWLELLHYSQDSELFCNAVYLTADRYVELLTRAVSNAGNGSKATPDIELIPLTPQVPRHLAQIFTRRCIDQLSKPVLDAYDNLKAWTDPV